MVVFTTLLGLLLLPLAVYAQPEPSAQDEMLLEMQGLAPAERDSGPCVLGEAPQGLDRLREDQGQRRKQVFEAVYASQELYSPGNCTANIWRLLDQFSKCGVDFQGAEVLYVVEDDLTIDVDRVRPDSDPEGWLFHVVLSLRGGIYDLDYGSSPTVESVSSYFSSMFARRAGKGWPKMSVRRIPASGYHRDYDFDRTAEHGMYHYVLPENNPYPTVRVRDYVAGSAGLARR